MLKTIITSAQKSVLFVPTPKRLFYTHFSIIFLDSSDNVFQIGVVFLAIIFNELQQFVLLAFGTFIIWSSV